MTDNALETAERLIGEENVRKLKWAAITCVWCADEAAREQDLETAWNWSERAVLGRNKFRQWARAWKRAAKKWFDLAQIGGEYAAENSQIADEFLAQRNEARDWAIRLKRERDEAQKQVRFQNDNWRRCADGAAILASERDKLQTQNIQLKQEQLTETTL